MLKLLAFIGGLFLLLPFYGAGQSDTLNQTDSKGLKQGYWIITGKMRPDKGICPTCIYEEGTYLDDRRNGIWKKYFKDGQTVRLKGTYVNNRPNGPYTKYYESGCVREEGDFKRGNNRRFYKRYHLNCVLAEESFYNEEGKIISKNSYYENGCKEAVIEHFQGFSDSSIVYRYSKDTCGLLISTTKYLDFDPNWRTHHSQTYIPKVYPVLKYEGDCDYFEILDTLNNGHHEIKDSLGRVIIDAEIKDGWIEKGMMYCWNENGESLEYKYKNKSVKDLKRIQPKEVEVDSTAPSGETGLTKNGTNFKPNAYNKLYSKEDELWLDGEFKNGSLWNGKEYIFDSDGILVKIKIYKNGKYHSDGSL